MQLSDRCLSAPLSSHDKAARSAFSLRDISFRTNRRSGGFFKRPSARRNPVVHCVDRHTVQFCDLGPRNSFVAHIDDCSVSSLSFSSGPCAVIREVAKSVVLALYCQVVSITGSLRPLVEGFKHKPFLAYSYSFSAITFVGHVPTSTEHVAPTVVDSGSFHAMCGAACANRMPRSLAPAGYAFAIAQIGADGRPLGSAGAFAQPQSRPSFLVSGPSNHNPLAEYKSGNINKFGIFHGFPRGVLL